LKENDAVVLKMTVGLLVGKYPSRIVWVANQDAGISQEEYFTHPSRKPPTTGHLFGRYAQ